MNLTPKLFLMMFPVNLAMGLGYQLDVLLGVSLKKGGLLPEQTGPYLRDSFRMNSLIPALEKIQEELEDLHTSNHWEVVTIIFLALWTILGNLFMIWKMRKIFKKRAEEEVDFLLLEFYISPLTILRCSFLSALLFCVDR